MHKKYWAGMHRKYHVKMYKKYYMRMYRFVLTVTGETRNLVTKTRQEEEMNISINRDIEKYQETVVMGLTARQLIFSIASIACGGAIVLLTYRHVGLTGSAYIAIPVVAPLALNGFYSYQGMSFTQMLKRKMWFAFRNRPLAYISEESEKNIKRMRMEEERQRKKEDKKKNRRSNKNRK